jgi:hypothetical protein
MRRDGRGERMGEGREDGRGERMGEGRGWERGEDAPLTSCV